MCCRGSYARRSSLTSGSSLGVTVPWYLTDRVPDRADPALAVLVDRRGHEHGSAQILTGVWARAPATGPTTCVSTWRGCAASRRRTRPGPATCSPNPAWATGTNREQPRCGTRPADY